MRRTMTAGPAAVITPQSSDVPGDMVLPTFGPKNQSSIPAAHVSPPVSQLDQRAAKKGKASIYEDLVNAVAPPGWEKSVKKMKKSKDITNPFALAWYMKNRGMKPANREDEDSAFDAAVQSAMAELAAGQQMPKVCELAAAGDVHAYNICINSGTLVPQKKWW